MEKTSQLPYSALSTAERPPPEFRSGRVSIDRPAGFTAANSFERTFAMRHLARSSCAFFLVGSLLAGQSPADEWGTLKGRIVFTGEVPQPEPLEIRRDEDVCGQHNLTDASLIVNKENKGLQNVVVWLSTKDKIQVHPSLQAPPKPAMLDNKNCRFEPRIVRLRTDQTLQSINSDPVAHNVAVYARRNTPFSEIVPQDKPLEKTFAREELLPIRVDCSIHSWMRAYLIITDHPYSAVTDKDGNFAIPNLPRGDWQFKFWHEKIGYLKSINHGEELIELKRGTWPIKIDQDEVALNELSVSSLEDE